MVAFRTKAWIETPERHPPQDWREVAFRTKAWIETNNPFGIKAKESGRLPHEGVDRNSGNVSFNDNNYGRLPHEGVDRNTLEGIPEAYAIVAFRTKAWIETLSSEIGWSGFTVAFRTKAWIETRRSFPGADPARVAFRTKAWIETRRHGRGFPSKLVAFRTKAWIET